MSTATITGLASGLDTNSIVQGLLAIDKSRVTQLQQSEAAVTHHQTAFKDIDAKLLALQSATAPLSQTINSVFDAMTVMSSDSTQVTAAASSGAVPGIYKILVNSLAQAQEIASQGFNSQDSAITQGNLQIKAGSGATATVTIDGTNDTLAGLVNAINSAGAGVTASIINDGSGAGSQPYRLLLTANQSGSDNAIALTNHLAADNGGAIKPVLDTTYIGAAVPSASYTGTSTPTVNTGAGAYTGASNNTYQFTVVQGGTVGTDSISLAYTDSTGADTGTINLGNGDAGVFKDVAQGLQVQFNAGTLVAGQTFSVDAFVPNVAKATNASVTVGSGPGALTIQSDTNQVENVINNVTLNLVGVNSSQPVTLTVSNNTQQAAQDITNFVSAYNDVLQTIDSLSTFDPNTNTAGLLLGNSDASAIENDLRNALGNAVAGVNPLLNNLGALGITTNSTGQLDVDQTRLNAVLSGQVAGISFKDVQQLFAFSATSTNPGIQFISARDSTKPSTTPYQVVISQAATHASITATNSLAATTVIDGTNDTFSISVDGQSLGPFTLAHQTYAPQQLVQEIQGKINASNNLGGRQVAVALNGSQLTITSDSYGRSSQVAIGAGTALAALGFAGTETNNGQDVVGHFLVNGNVEQAVGTGQLLIGDSTNANTSGLAVLATLTPAQVPASGPAASLNVTQGLTSQLTAILANLLDPVSGRLKSIDDGYTQSFNTLQQNIAQQNLLIAQKQQTLEQEFASLETTISKLQTIGNFLSSQFTTTNSTKQSGFSTPSVSSGVLSTGSTGSSGSTSSTGSTG